MNYNSGFLKLICKHISVLVLPYKILALTGL